MAKISEIGITERHIASDAFKCEHACIILLQINSNQENEIV